MGKFSINTDMMTLSSKWDDLKFHLKRGHGHLLGYLGNRFRWHQYPRLGIPGRYPEHIDLELAAVCNLKCPMCYTINDRFKREVSATLMSWEVIERVLREAGKGNVFSVRLSLRGEPTLNRHFYEAARLAKEVGIREVSSLTNATKMTPELFERLVDIDMDWLTISADGIGDTYNEIRYPSKYDDLLEKLRAFKEIKERKGKLKPVVKVQGVWPAIRDDPQAFFSAYKPLADMVSSGALVDYLNKDSDETIRYKEKFTCHVLWQRLFITAAGKACLCHNDIYEDHVIGDVGESTIEEIWNGKLLQEAREVHRDGRGVACYKACKDCYLPRESEEGAEVAIVGGSKVKVSTLVGRKQSVGQ